MIFFEYASPIPGSASSSPLVAELISNFTLVAGEGFEEWD
jgi:hypothetical protein